MSDTNISPDEHAEFIARAQRHFRPGYKQGTVRIRTYPPARDVLHAHIGSQLAFTAGLHEEPAPVV